MLLVVLEDKLVLQVLPELMEPPTEETVVKVVLDLLVETVLAVLVDRAL